MVIGESYKPREVQPLLSISEALARIHGIENMAMQMGANDYEYAAFASIKKQLHDHTISPEEALARAQGILDSKQDYH